MGPDWVVFEAHIPVRRVMEHEKWLLGLRIDIRSDALETHEVWREQGADGHESHDNTRAMRVIVGINM